MNANAAKQIPLDKLPPNLRPDQVANYLNCTDDHVLHLVAEGSLPAIKIGTAGQRQYHRIPKASLQAFLEARKVF